MSTQSAFNLGCQDCGLFDRKFNRNDCDIIFTKAAILISATAYVLGRRVAGPSVRHIIECLKLWPRKGGNFALLLQVLQTLLSKH